jgi:ribonuclease HI
VNPKNWIHPADIISVKDTKDGNEESLWQIFTDGGEESLWRVWRGVGSGVAVFTGQELMERLKCKLDNGCPNNHAEQLAVLKALEAIEKQQVNYNKHRTVVIHTDSKITLDLIRNAQNHNHLLEEIKNRTVNLNSKPEQTELANKI